jgi:hypothetical protein
MDRGTPRRGGGSSVGVGRPESSRRFTRQLFGGTSFVLWGLGRQFLFKPSEIPVFHDLSMDAILKFRRIAEVTAFDQIAQVRKSVR